MKRLMEYKKKYFERHISFLIVFNEKAIKTIESFTPTCQATLSSAKNPTSPSAASANAVPVLIKR